MKNVKVKVLSLAALSIAGLQASSEPTAVVAKVARTPEEQAQLEKIQARMVKGSKAVFEKSKEIVTGARFATVIRNLGSIKTTLIAMIPDLTKLVKGDYLVATSLVPKAYELGKLALSTSDEITALVKSDPNVKTLLAPKIDDIVKALDVPSIVAKLRAASADANPIVKIGIDGIITGLEKVPSLLKSALQK